MGRKGTVPPPLRGSTLKYETCLRVPCQARPVTHNTNIHVEFGLKFEVEEIGNRFPPTFSNRGSLKLATWQFFSDFDENVLIVHIFLTHKNQLKMFLQASLNLEKYFRSPTSFLQVVPLTGLPRVFYTPL